MKVHPDLIGLVCCPKCHHALDLAADESSLSCSACRLAYPVVDGIPVLLIEEAKPIVGAASTGGAVAP